jgi:uncharacterized protein (UPF0335 family)
LLDQAVINAKEASERANRLEEEMEDLTQEMQVIMKENEQAGVEQASADASLDRINILQVQSATDL